MEKRMTTVAGLARLTTLSEATIRLYLRTTDIPHFRAGKRIFFDVEKVLDWFGATGGKGSHKSTGEAAGAER